MPIRTLNQIIGELKEIATQHRQINNFTVGTIEDFATSGTTNYPAYWVGYDSNAFASRTEDFTFTFWLVDRVKKDRSNLIEIHSDMKQVAMDVIAQLNDAGYGWKVSESVNLSAIYEPFHEDEIAGWSFDFTISQPFTKDVCQIPFISPIAIGRSQSGYNPNTPVSITTYNYGLFSQIANSSTVTNTTTESSIIGTGVGSLTVPANTFKVGDSYQINMSGHINSKNNDSIRIRIKTTTGVLLADTNAVTMPNCTNQHFDLKINFTVRSIGTTGVASIASTVMFTYTKNASNAFEGENVSIINNTTFNTTVSNTLDITAQWSDANTLNSIYSELLTLFKTY